MIELSLSVVAWISVVLVQAIVHYVVLGRGRSVGGKYSEHTVEECMSLATVDTTDDADASFTISESGYHGSVIPEDPSTPILTGEKDIVVPEPEQFFELLDQTGTELLKVSLHVRKFLEDFPTVSHRRIFVYNRVGQSNVWSRSKCAR